MNEIKNKKIIVTGGLGFIGSHIVEELYPDNEVIIIDNESTGKMDNIKHFKDRVIVEKGDINSINLNKIFEDVDYIFHEAALPSVPRSIKDPIQSNEANITGTLKVMKAASECNVKKVIIASSSSVYGDTPLLPKVETMPINPQSPYAVTKATGELYCKVFKEIYGLQTVALRYFNVFGPRQDPNSQYSAVIPKFITAIKENNSPIVYGDGTQSRDFTFVKNVVNANILAAETTNIGTYNVACGRKIIINDLIQIINEIMGKEIKSVHVDQRTGDIKHSLANISKIISIGYSTTDNFKDELIETVKFFTNKQI